MKYFSICILLVLNSFISCKKSDQSSHTNEPLPGHDDTVALLLNLPAGWHLSTTLSAGLPTNVQAYVFDSVYSGKKTKAYCLVYDSKVGNVEFKPAMSSAGKKPSEFFRQESGKIYACINGGFFGSNQSYALVKYNNAVMAPNIKSVNRIYNGVSTAYYPTRAAFGISADGKPSVAWIYSINNSADNIYRYNTPSPNVEGELPQQVPDAFFPDGGEPWEVVSAIGGSPMLLKNDHLSVTDTAELINVDNKASRARSAIGYTDSGIVILIAVEGNNNAEGYAGLTLKELAGFLKTLGCSNAINLDGGGSTSLIISNQLTVKPSDAVERPVVSVVIIKGK